MENKYNQKERVDKVVSTVLDEIGYLWEEAISKLKEDNLCFRCKKELDSQLNVFKGTSDKGSVSFVSLCDSCVQELREIEEEKDRRKE